MGPRWAASMSAKLRVRAVKNCRIMLLSVGLSEKKTVDLNGAMKHPAVVEGSYNSFLCLGLAHANGRRGKISILKTLLRWDVCAPNSERTFAVGSLSRGSLAHTRAGVFWFIRE